MSKNPKEETNMSKPKVTTEQLNEMTKDQLAAFAQEHGVTVKGVKDVRKADLVAIIAENVNKTVRGRKNRIKAAVLALIEARGIDAVTLAEFIDTVLAIYPEWDKGNDEPTAKKHLSWYKSFYRKNVLGKLARPRKAKDSDAPAVTGNATTHPIELAAAGANDSQPITEPTSSSATVMQC